jgi:hypothetical protein
MTGAGSGAPLVPGYTLANIPGTTFDLDPSKASTLTLSGGLVTQATDAQGGAYVLTGGTSKPAIDYVNGRSGYPCLSLTAAGETLFCANGPALGSDHGFSLYAVANLSSTQYPAAMALGSSSFVSQRTFIVGGRAGKFWAGSVSPAPTGPEAGAIDGAFHLVEGHYDPATGKVWLYVDGNLIATPSAANFLTAAGGFPNGFGLAPQSNASFEGTCKLARALFRLGGLDSDLVRRQIQTLLALQYGLALPPIVTGAGDSIMDGSGDGASKSTGNPIARLASYLGGWTFYSDGHPGFTTSAIVTNITGLTAGTILTLGSGARPKRIALAGGGTNDNAQLVPIATWKTSYAAEVAALNAQGYEVFNVTLFPWVNGSPFAWDSSVAGQQNQWLKDTYGARVIDWASTPEMQLVAGAYDGTYRWSDNSTGQLGHPKGPGNAALARDAFKVIGAYLRSQ